ncbi:MAG: arginine--tRNA ligase [Victivallales bacterium]|jgi:arginyl-tRNA synthetase|nr:arginine--tRNA ligase [Victivallales bacterium]
MKFSFISDLEGFLQSTFGVDAVSVAAELCPPHFEGDMTVNCFLLAKVLRRNPMQIAQQVAEFLAAHADVEKAEAIKAFVNVTVAGSAVMRDTVADEQALLGAVHVPEAERRRVLIEFSAPNTNKPQHLGHVRNNTTGMAAAALLQRVGHDVVRINLVNDRGVHICKSMIAYQRFGEGVTPESSGKKGDHLVGEFYVRFDQELREQLAQLRIDQPELAEKSSDDLFLETEIGRATQDMLVAWEKADPEVRELWETMNGWVLEGFTETYRRLGVEFDHTYFESRTYTLGRDIIEEGLAKGVFHKREDGATVIDFDDPGLGTKVVLRSDGTSVYVTQDIGTTLLKQRDYEPDQQIWVVADEQLYHFRVLFAILKALGYEWADRLTHMAYGMVNLPSGRMKSREGTVVDADDLFEMLEGLAREATLERAGADVPEDLDERARAISMAALKFMLLKVNPKTTMMFDPEASLRFEGDTGPYVLYAYARISSMLRRASEEALAAEVDWSVLGTKEEKALALRCAQYPEIMQKAATNLDGSVVTGYLLDLAKDFSKFYQACPVLAAETPALIRARLELTARVRMLLRDGLNALTIDALESM